MSKIKVLIVDDKEDFRKMLGGWLAEEGYGVIEAEEPSEGQEKLFSEQPQIIFWDLRFPTLDNNEDESLKIVGDICSQRPDLPVIIITDYANLEKAVRAVRDLGVFNFLDKDLDYDKLRVILKNASDRFKLYNRVQFLDKRVEMLEEELESLEAKYPEIVGKNPAINKSLKIVEKVADTDSTVLIRGESGTGKELIASALHQGSSRSNMPFITINCAAIPEALIESELFGFEKGVFTGATQMKIGKFESADKGTIFLDEIGEMNPDLQKKLLRVLQERAIQRVGGTQEIPTDARIVQGSD